MAIGNFEVGAYRNLTASANVKSSQGAVIGFYVNSTTAGTIQFYDDAATGTTTPITGLITPAIGFHRLPVAFASGLYAVIGATLNVTIAYA
jgi:hypothetical protein